MRSGGGRVFSPNTIKTSLEWNAQCNAPLAFRCSTASTLCNELPALNYLGAAPMQLIGRETEVEANFPAKSEDLVRII